MSRRWARRGRTGLERPWPYANEPPPPLGLRWCANLLCPSCDARRHQSPSVLVPALRTVGNIVTGDDMQTQTIINCGALPCLLNLLTTSHKKSIKKEACWTISNITAGTKEQARGAQRRAAWRARLAAALLWTARPPARHTLLAPPPLAPPGTLSLPRPPWHHPAPLQIQTVVDAGIVPPLVHLLATAEFDIKKEAAWAISNATRCGGGVVWCGWGGGGAG